MASFRKELSAQTEFSLVLVEKIWQEGFGPQQLQRAQEFFEHALDELLYGQSLNEQRDSVWIGRMLLIIFAFPNRREIAAKALDAW